VENGRSEVLFLRSVTSRKRTLDLSAFSKLSPKIGTAVVDRELVATGGRMLNVTTLGTNIAEAQSSACEAVDKVSFKSGFCRHDIG
jgi:phosphoribosylamine-glycine ligase